MFASNFFRVVREITPKVCGKMFKWTTGALSALHEGSEARLITILEKANLAAIHAGRVTLMVKDIQLAMKLSDATEHYKSTTLVIEVESEQQKKENEKRRKEEIENLRKQQKTGVRNSDESDDEIIIRRSTKRKQVSSLQSSDSESDDQHISMKTVRCSKKLTKDQFDHFEREQSFTDELVTIVMDEGWDTVDIENFVLVYNHTNGKHIALPKFRRIKDTYVNLDDSVKKGNETKKKESNLAKNKRSDVKEKEKGQKKNEKVDGSGKKKDVGKGDSRKEARGRRRW